jgi:DNA (cytosine-5)-methyltransferase 3A
MVEVLSLFDGMSCGRLALNEANIKVKEYHSSEIDKHALKVAKANFPDNKQLGNVLNIQELPFADILLGGSPCQGFSRAGKQLNFDDPRSKLFFEYVRILNKLKEKNPDVKFLLENVKMRQEYQDIISEFLGVEPIKIDSAIHSAQRRVRLYWTNIEGIGQPKPEDIKLANILQDIQPTIKPESIWSKDFARNEGNVLIVREATKKGFIEVRSGECFDATFPTSQTRRGRYMKEKSNCLTATANCFYLFVDGFVRQFTSVEMERLQGVPDNYTAVVSDPQRSKMLGNGWNIKTIAHILSSLKNE